MKKTFKRLHDNDELTPRHINELQAEIERWNKGSATGSITFSNREGGPLWGTTDEGTTTALIHTTGTITARSGTAPGSGPAKLVSWDGTALSDGEAITLKNISAKTGGIASGKYGFAVSLFGVWWAVSIEC